MHTNLKLYHDKKLIKFKYNGFDMINNIIINLDDVQTIEQLKKYMHRINSDYISNIYMLDKFREKKHLSTQYRLSNITDDDILIMEEQRLTDNIKLNKDQFK
jgi:hypothetical protein